MSRNIIVLRFTFPDACKTSDFDQNRIANANRRGSTHDYGITAV